MIKKLLFITFLLTIPSLSFADHKIGFTYFNDQSKKFTYGKEFSEIYIRNEFYINNDLFSWKINAGYDSEVELAYMNKINKTIDLTAKYYPRNGAILVNLEQII